MTSRSGDKARDDAYEVIVHITWVTKGSGRRCHHCCRLENIFVSKLFTGSSKSKG